MAIVGSAYVEIHVVSDAVGAEIRRGLEQALNGVGSRAGRQFADEFNASARAGLGRGLQDSLDRTVRDSSRAGSNAGDGFFSRLSEKLRRPILAQVGIDPASIRRAITNLAALTNALQLVALPAVAAAILPYFLSLASSVTQALGVLWLLPAAILGAASALGVMLLGFKGLGDALGPTGTPAQLEKVREAMAKLHPEARNMVRELRALSDEWRTVQQTVQGNLFRDLANPIRDLAQTYIPVLREQLGGLASAYNLAARNTIGVLLSPQSVQDTVTGLNNMQVGARASAAGFGPLVEAIRDIAVVGSTFLPQLGQSFTNVTTRFAAFIAEARQTGDLARWIQTGIDTLNQMGRIIGNVGQMFAGLFAAVRGSGRSFLDILEQITGNLATKWNTPSGIADLTETFINIRTTVGFVIEKFQQLWPAIAAAAGAIGALIASMAPLSGVVIPLVVAGLVPMLNAIRDMAPVLGPLIVMTYTAIVTYKLLYGAFVIIRSAVIGYQLAMAVLTGGTIANTAATKINTAALYAGQVAAVAVRGAVIAWTAVQWALNVALAANPIGIVIAAIVALIAAVVAIGYGIYKLVQNWEEVWGAIKNATSAVVDWFRGPFMDFWRGIPGFFSNMWSNVTEFFTGAWGSITSGVSTAFSNVVGFFTGLPGRVVSALQGLGSAIAETATNAWNSLVTSAQTAGQNVLDFVTTLPNKIAYGLGYLIGTLARVGLDAWNAFTGAIVTAWDATYAFVTGLPARFMAGLAALGGYLGNLATTAWDNFTTGITNAWNATWEWITALPGRFVSGLQNIGTSLLNLATTVWDNFTSGITSAWNATWAWITALPGRFVAGLVGLGAMLMTTAIDAWNGFTEGVTNAWNATVAWFQSIPGRIGAFFTNLGQMFMDIGGNAWNGFTSGVTNAWNATIAWFQSVPGMITGALANAGQWLTSVGGDIIEGLRQGIANAWNSFWGWLTGLWDSFIQGIKDAMGIASPSRVFADIGIQILQGLWDGLKSMVGGIMGFFQDLWNSILSFFGTIWNSITSTATSAWNNISGFFSNAFNAFLGFFQNIWQSVLDFFVQRWQNLQSNAVAIWNAISNFFTGAFNAFVTFFRNIWQSVLDFFTQRWQNLQTNAVNIWNAIRDFFSNAFAAFTTFFQNVWQNILNFFTTTWNNLRQTGINIWNAISSFFSGAFSSFTSFFSNIWNNISSVFNNVWSAIRDTAERWWNNIRDFFSGAFAAFTTSFTNVWDNIRGAFDRAFSGIKSIAERIWNDVKSIFSGAINMVIRVPNWIIDKINGLFNTNISRIPDFRFAKGGTPADQVAGRVSGIGGQRADRVPALLSTEEHVWTGQEVRGAGGHEGVRKLREAARQGILKRDTAEYAANMRKATMGGELGHFSKGGFPKFATGGQLFAEILKTFPRAKSNSQYRPGDPGYHGRNMAVDLGEAGFSGGAGRPYLAAMKRHLVDNYGRSREIIYNGLGNDRPNIKNGAAFAYSASVQGQHRNHVHWAHDGDVASTRSSGAAGIGNAIKGGLSDAVSAGFDFLMGPFKGAAESFMRSVVPDRPEWMEKLGQGVLDKTWEGAKAWIDGGNGGGNVPPPGTAPAGTGVERWRSTVRRALGIMGLPTNLDNTTLRRMNQESGGNPRAINNWDINATRGTPSKGLMQVIDPTFRANAHPSYNRDIWDPMSNILASMRYAMRRYGSLPAAYDRRGGYDSGGWLMPGVTLAENNTGKPEAVITDPVTSFKTAMIDVFRRLAPEMAFSLEAGAKSQIEEFSRIVMNDKNRSPELRNALASVFDKYFPNLAAAVTAGGSQLAAENRENMQSFITRVLNTAPARTTLAPQRVAIRWGDTLSGLAKRFGTTIDTLMRLNPQIKNPNRIYAGATLNLPARQVTESAAAAMARTAKLLLSQMPQELSAKLASAFPEVVAAINSGAPNLQTVLQQRASEILRYFGDTNTQVGSLVAAIENGPTTAQQLAEIGNSVLSPAAAKPSNTITFQSGAFAVTIQGNADAVTVDELKLVLQGWGEQIVREYEART